MKATTGHSIEDKLFWSPKAMIRGKLACMAFGIDLSNPAAIIEAGHLEGKTCEVEVEERKWTGRDGKEHDGYRVAFRGYHALTAAQATAQAKASQAAKAAVRTLWNVDEAKCGSGSGGRLMADQISEGRAPIDRRPIQGHVRCP